jgi:hypothetical protein
MYYPMIVPFLSIHLTTLHEGRADQANIAWMERSIIHDTIESRIPFHCIRASTLAVSPPRRAVLSPEEEYRQIISGLS